MSVVREVQVLVFPGAFVVRGVAGSGPEIGHPGFDVGGFDSIGDFKPAVGEEVFSFLWGQGLVWCFWWIGREVFGLHGSHRSGGGFWLDGGCWHGKFQYRDGV